MRINSWVASIKDILVFLGPLVSLLAVYYTRKTYIESQPNIKAEIADHENAALLVVPDRISATFPDRFWNSLYRVIIDIVIENKSSEPISIINIKLNNNYEVNPYIKMGKVYPVTMQKNYIDMNGGKVPLNRSIIKKKFWIENYDLRPVINLKGHTALRGFLIFNIGDDPADLKTRSSNKLSFKTPNKIFTVEIARLQYLKTVLSPQEQYQSDHPRTLDDNFPQ